MQETFAVYQISSWNERMNEKRLELHRATDHARGADYDHQLFPLLG